MFAFIKKWLLVFSLIILVVSVIGCYSTALITSQNNGKPTHRNTSIGLFNILADKLISPQPSTNKLNSVNVPKQFTANDGHIAYNFSCRLVKECTPRDAGTPQALKAALWIQRELQALDTPVIVDNFTALQGDKEVQFANVLMPFTNAVSAPWIILISHFDTLSTNRLLDKKSGNTKFEGANDGASTCGLLFALANHFKREGMPPCNILLAWLDGEECLVNYNEHDGFQGSQRLLTWCKQNHYQPTAVFCLDMLGDKDLCISLPTNGSPTLREAVLKASKKLRLQKYVRDEKEFYVLDDHVAFYDAGYPALDLIDFQYGSKPKLNDYWHTTNDTLDKISPRSLTISGAIILETILQIMRNEELGIRN